jgi:uncharacterized protein YdiU (UPF0061 family)
VPYQPAPSFPSLGRHFYDPVQAASFPQHALRYRNDRAAATVGLDPLSDAEWERHFAALEPLDRNLSEPLALHYHGHQFRQYNPALGDGRGFLLAQLLDGSGRVLDLGTKGSGTTPFSRGGDGRLTLKGAVREILATEMLEALGVYTSKTFSVFETGETLIRHDEPSPTRGAVLVRLSHSHIRFGSFQRQAWARKPDRLRALLDYTLDNCFPALAEQEHTDTPAALLDEVLARCARLAATWMMAGFVHGVLNTDNMNVTGESFDYGPWRFLPTWDPQFTAAYFDHGGMFAYGQQPDSVHWSLVRFAEALLPIADEAAIRTVLETWETRFAAAERQVFLERLGVRSRGDDEDAALLAAAVAFWERSEIPFERLFFDWHGGDVSALRAADRPAASFYEEPGFAPLRRLLAAREPADPTRLEHPYFDGEAPCTMLIDEMEATWAPIAAKGDDWSALDEKLTDIRHMRDALGLHPRPR